MDFARQRQLIVNWHREHPADCDDTCGECGASSVALLTTDIGTAFCWPCEKERTKPVETTAATVGPVQMRFKKRSE